MSTDSSQFALVNSMIKHLHSDFSAVHLCFFARGDPSVDDSSKSIGLMDLLDGMGMKVIDVNS